MKLFNQKDTFSNLSALSTQHFPAVVMAVALVVAAVVWSSTYYAARARSMSGTIDVKGTASQPVTADRATWNIRLERKSADRKEGYEQLGNDEQRIYDFLRSNGLREDEIDRRPRSTEPETHYDQQQSRQVEDGWRSSVNLVGSTGEVNKFGPLVERLTEFSIEQNIVLSSNNVEYYYSGVESLKKDLLEKAITNAQERAEALARVTRTKVGKISSASQGIFQVNAAGDGSVSDYGNYDTTTINKEVLVTVSVEFEVR